MKKLVSLLFAAVLTLGLCAALPAAQTSAYPDGDVDVVEYVGEMMPGKFNNIWTAPTQNVLTIITPGNQVTGTYLEKLYAEYDAENGCYVVTEKVANHRVYTKKVEKKCIGLLLDYAPLSSFASDIAKANWYVWQQIKVGDRLRFSSNINVRHKTLAASGEYGKTGYKNESRIYVETVRKVYPPLTPYSNKTIVAQGDSITVGGGWTSVWSDYLSCNVINSGFGGDTASAALHARYDKYVAAFKPEIVFVCYGINDAVGGAAGTNRIETYKNALRTIYDKNTALGATTVFTTPNNVLVSSMEEGGRLYKGPYTGVGETPQGYITMFFHGMNEVAEEKGCVLIDVYQKWLDEGLSPDCLIHVVRPDSTTIDFAHPSGEGYDKNFELQKEVLVSRMAEICGTTMRAMKGSTVSCVMNGLPECEKVVKDAAGAEVTDINAVLEDGFTVSYTKDGADLGTFTVQTFSPTKLLVREDAPFDLVNGRIIYDKERKVSDITGCILNDGVTAKDKNGNPLSPDDKAALGAVIGVESIEQTFQVTKEDGSTEEDGIPGDVDGDGATDNLDAALVLQYDAGIMNKADLPKFDFADVNSDGEVDNLDAALILQYDAGLIEDFQSVGN